MERSNNFSRYSLFFVLGLCHPPTNQLNDRSLVQQPTNTNAELVYSRHDMSESIILGDNLITNLPAATDIIANMPWGEVTG